MARDPVCGMDVDEAKAPARAVYQGRTYYFCSARCKGEFDRNPRRYVEGEAGGEPGASHRHGGD